VLDVTDANAVDRAFATIGPGHLITCAVGALAGLAADH
jgi:hypothetical protein